MTKSILDQSVRCACVVGLQWGDEAKGKIVDLLSDECDIVVRFNGGANAGHTVVRDGRTYKFSLLPTGVLRPHVTSVIGNGLVINPVRLLEEIAELNNAGIDLTGRLVISDRAHVIFPYHYEEERLNETGNGQAIGTTGRGIGPCYQDKVGRICGIRAHELLDGEHLRERLAEIVPRKNRLLRALSPQARQFEVDAVCAEYANYGEQLRPYIKDATCLLHDAIGQGKRLLFEGAQGSLLDIDFGSYPFVTSSNTIAASVWNGAGVPARRIDTIIGVIKAYTTRVGRGPFPTELTDAVGDHIRKVGKEYGTVTGRPRRCGWLDAVALRFTAALCDVDRLAIMLLDVLSELPEIRICTAYEIDGERTDRFPASAEELARCQPVYETLAGWQTPIDTVRHLRDLPTQARRYLDRIAELLQRPVAIASVGPDHAETICCD